MSKTADASGLTVTRPVRQILVMLVVVGVVGFGVWTALPVIKRLFVANLLLNSAIGGWSSFRIKQRLSVFVIAEAQAGRAPLQPDPRLEPASWQLSSTPWMTSEP